MKIITEHIHRLEAPIGDDPDSGVSLADIEQFLATAHELHKDLSDNGHYAKSCVTIEDGTLVYQIERTETDATHAD